MEKKNFIGLDGLKYFWTKIEAKVIKIIEEQIAEIIAEAPESLNTLKEIADWISTHEDSASAMNTAILANTEAISGKADKNHTHTKSQITDFDHNHDDRYYTESEVDTKLSGKSDTGHTHTALSIDISGDILDFNLAIPGEYHSFTCFIINGGPSVNLLNAPNSDVTHWFVKAFRKISEIVQIAIETHYSKVYIRKTLDDGANWSSWVKFTTE